MKSTRIRKFHPSDLDSMVQLLSTRTELDYEEALKRGELIKWLAFHNPFGNGEATYYVVEDSDKIIAHLGRMPVEFVINGNLQRGYFIHDLFVHPDYRKKGLGYFISRDLYNLAEKDSDSFCCLIWTSVLNLKMQRLRKYHVLEAYTYVKVLNPYPKLKNFVKNKLLSQILSLPLKLILNMVCFFLFLQPARGKAFVINRFEPEFDELVERIMPKLGICSLKTADYLNWRYIDRPFNSRHVIGVEYEDQLKGVVILTIVDEGQCREGIILDMIADPDDKGTLNKLTQTAICYFRSNSVDKIDCCFTNDKIVKILKRHLFIKSPFGIPLVLANLDKTSGSNQLLDVAQWHLTYGESDKLMLSP